jgi:hypothetical protein
MIQSVETDKQRTSIPVRRVLIFKSALKHEAEGQISQITNQGPDHSMVILVLSLIASDALPT